MSVIGLIPGNALNVYEISGAYDIDCRDTVSNKHGDGSKKSTFLLLTASISV